MMGASHLGFPIQTILATFDLQVPPILPTKFRANWPFHSGEEAQNRFSIRMILAIFIYNLPIYLLTNFKSIGLLVQERKRKNILSKRQPW